MKLPVFLIFIAVLNFSCQAQIADKEKQIAMAIQAAPPEKQAGATVYGYDKDGEIVLIREGANEMICVADDPKKEGISVACYHSDLKPFMDRGNALRKDGKRPDEIFAIREKETVAGTLQMPKNPSTLHVLSGNEAKWNTETGKLENAKLRYVVYIPFATAESTGLPIRPMVPGGPWIMDPGTHRAHIMISPEN
jgi:hypothetical protein